MRLTTVILIATLMQVSASGFSQKKVTYVKKKTDLWGVFNAMKLQTGYKVLWSDEVIKTTEMMDANFTNATIDEVMTKVLAGRPLSYIIQDEMVVIRRDVPSFRPGINKVLPSIDVRGRVLDDDNKPLVGAIVRIKDTKIVIVTDNNGEFSLKNVGDKAVLLISYLGYQTLEIPASQSSNSIRLVPTNDKLNEVEIVSTGYQNLPKERATGSFTLVDNKLLNRSVSPDLISRLKGITNGLLVDKTVGFNIRGRSTIFSNTLPLIVVDNFPFEGDINTINPDMVESVTILKDAAAASIWGAFSGNGVIVITTKKGKLNQAPAISLKADLTVGSKPDLYYEPQLSSSQFIDVEQFLFDKGKFAAKIKDGYSTISPVIAILEKIKLDKSYAIQGKAEIDALRGIDYRDQLNKYYFRKSTQQRYAAEVRGGGDAQTYYFFAGYDKALPNQVALSNSRITLKANNSYNLLQNRLQLNTDIMFSKSQSKNTNTNGYFTYVPYEQLADENGNALATLSSSGLRTAYTDTAGKGRLLDWKNRPLEELRKGYTQNSDNLTDYRINLGMVYKIINALNFSVNYQYYNASTKGEINKNRNSFYTRDLINTYSQINSLTNAVTRPIPMGDIYTTSFERMESNYGRAQLNFNQNFASKHVLAAILGYEVRDNQGGSNSFAVYGYNPETTTNILVDQFSFFPNYVTGGQDRVGGEGQPSEKGTIDRYISLYGNASYIYDNKYIISGSYRKDESNLFGVKANQKGVPLWSAGLAWNLDKEPFFNVNWLSTLQLKATYGYNGNVNKSISAYLTASPTSVMNQFTGLRPYTIVNPPNDNLRWERVKNINTALIFSTRNARISGSLEFYIKDGMDLIASSPIASQTGVLVFKGNTADTHTKGVDLQLNSINLNGVFNWNTTYIFNYVKDKVTGYKAVVGRNASIVTSSSAGLSPLINYPINSIFAYKWAGLDASGNPQGFLNGVVGTDYAKILNSADPSELRFFGSRTPTIHGGLRNSFSYKNIELSFNITYKMGYYFKRRSMVNSNVIGGSFRVRDFDLRWQKPGDELLTNVPALIYPNNTNRDAFYENSEVLIAKGDHIRFQDIQLNYTISRKQFAKLPFDTINIYTYATNFGLLWKANKYKLDPDVDTYPNPRIIAFGVKTNF
ncbi:SusC/RagA family TonB-linked outer membrane protein [Pedobacter gandavensis]|uniref:SusC/RagA family TonB-linked outer membrane protein n=1 Tax=Pedobacter gandavensis TaxID=2679963 RepID=UPI00293025E7|nr:SusC/RagA family TonB-linked outer membrane protein [Pedobacter gandavensis]